MHDDTTLLYYTIGAVIGLLLSYVLIRWIFSIDKRIRQNQSMINLLKQIAKKNGVTDDEIASATMTREELGARMAQRKE